jgi:hypothetical protein
MMQFRTVRQRKTGTEEYARPAGPRSLFFTFDYEVSHDPTIEGVGVQLNPDVKEYPSWEYGPDFHVGARIGWEDALYDDAVRLCCTKLQVLRTRDDPIGTRPHVIRLLLIDYVRNRIATWAEPIPPLRADWLTSDVVTLARGIHANAALDGLPALTDALLEAGCDDPLVIEHLLTCPDHAPSCWVVEMILQQIESR